MTQLGLFDRKPAEHRPRSFHVRSHQTVEEVSAGEAKAKRQEGAILEFFRYHDDQGNGHHTRWTPSEVHAAIVSMGQFVHETFRGPRPILPVTSVRRAITNLTTAGLLVHHRADRRPGPYGAKESTWSLA